MNEYFYLLGDFDGETASGLAEFGVELVSVCRIPVRCLYPYRSFAVARATAADWRSSSYLCRPGLFSVPECGAGRDFQTFCMKCLYGSPEPEPVVRELLFYVRHATMYGDATNLADPFVDRTFIRLDLDFACRGIQLAAEDCRA